MSGKKLCKLLEKLGFELIQEKGSHVRFKHTDGRRTVVPVHANEDIGKELLLAILSQIKNKQRRIRKVKARDIAISSKSKSIKAESF